MTGDVPILTPESVPASIVRIALDGLLPGHGLGDQAGLADAHITEVTIDVTHVSVTHEVPPELGVPGAFPRTVTERAPIDWSR